VDDYLPAVETLLFAPPSAQADTFEKQAGYIQPAFFYPIV
jgi:hypothetical protein